MLWLLLNCGIVYVCLLLLNANYPTDWAWCDRTGQDSTGRDLTGQDMIGLDRKQRDRTQQDRTQQDTKGTGRDVVVTVMFWCCVCVFVTPKRELCDGLSVTWPERTRLDGTGNDKTGRNGTRIDRTQRERYETERDRTWRGCSWWFRFSSSVGSGIVLCMYVKFYYLLVTDLSEKWHLMVQQYKLDQRLFFRRICNALKLIFMYQHQDYRTKPQWKHQYMK